MLAALRVGMPPASPRKRITFLACCWANRAVAESSIKGSRGRVEIIRVAPGVAPEAHYSGPRQISAWQREAGCLTVLGAATNARAHPVGKPWDRQRISGKPRRKFMSVPGLRRISAHLPQYG